MPSGEPPTIPKYTSLSITAGGLSLTLNNPFYDDCVSFAHDHIEMMTVWTLRYKSNADSISNVPMPHGLPKFSRLYNIKMNATGTMLSFDNEGQICVLSMRTPTVDEIMGRARASGSKSKKPVKNNVDTAEKCHITDALLLEKFCCDERRKVRGREEKEHRKDRKCKFAAWGVANKNKFRRIDEETPPPPPDTPDEFAMANDSTTDVVDPIPK